MTGDLDALYLFVLAAIAGYVLIVRVVPMLHLPLLGAAIFVHGIVLAGALIVYARGDALQSALALVAMVAATANLVGAWRITDRSLAEIAARRVRRPSAREARPDSGASAREDTVAAGTSVRDEAPAPDAAAARGTIPGHRSDTPDSPRDAAGHDESTHR